jgi:hypothetical protein
VERRLGTSRFRSAVRDVCEFIHAKIPCKAHRALTWHDSQHDLPCHGP